MRCLFRWLLAGSFAIGATFIFAFQSAAQTFRLGEWEGAFETLTDFTRMTTQTAGSETSRQTNTLSEELLTLRNVGAYLYDPDFINLSIGGTFGLTQNWLTTDIEKEADRGTLFGYDLSANILPLNKYSLNVFANRSQSFISGGLVGTIINKFQSEGARLFANQLYIPSTIYFTHEHREEESHTTGLLTRQSDSRNILRYEGQRGWIDSETTLRYEFVDDTDEVFPRNSYRSNELTGYYSIDFGPTLNRRLDSRLRYFGRMGFTDISALNLDELLTVKHTDQLQSQYNYSFSRVESDSKATTMHAASAIVTHRLYESLTTTAGLNATLQSLPGGEQNNLGGRLDFGYRKRLPWNGTLNIGIGGGLTYNNSRFETSETSVLGESYTFNPPQLILLQHPFAVTSSIVVKRTTVLIGCPEPSDPVGLVLGVDYLLSTSNDVTEIRPIPRSPVLSCINPGDTITVDYSFSVSPSLAFTTATGHLNFSVDYQWIRPYFIHEETNQNLISGRDGQFLNSQRSDTVGTELRYNGERLYASILGEGQRFKSQRNAYEALRSNQLLRFSILPELLLNLSADEASYSYTLQHRQSLSLFGGTALSYTPMANLSGDAFINIRGLQDSLAVPETNTEAGVRARWLYRSLEILPTLEFFNRQRGDTDTNQFRIMLRMIRRF